MTYRRPTPVYLQSLTWLLLFPLLYFAARGLLSFERAQWANDAGVGMVAAAATDADTAYFRIERSLIYGTILAALGLSFRGTIRVAKRNLLILLLPSLAILSTAWSQERVRTVPLSVFIFILTVFAIYLVDRFKETKLLELFNFVGIAVTLSSYILVAFWPSAGISSTYEGRPWQGLFVHKNLLGAIMVLFFATGYFSGGGSPLARFLLKVYMMATFILIVMSQSRTAWLELALLIAYLACEAVYIRAGKKDRLVASLAFISAAVVIGLVAYTYSGDIAVALGKSSDMTGRVEIFQAILPELWKRPWLGFGYQAFWLGLKGESAYVLLNPGLGALGNAENGVLQMWLELGLVGTGIIALVLYRSSRNAVYSLNRNPSRFVRWNCAILFITLLGLVNGDKFMYPDSIEWILLVTAYISLAEHVRTLKEAVVRQQQLAWAS